MKRLMLAVALILAVGSAEGADRFGRFSPLLGLRPETRWLAFYLEANPDSINDPELRSWVEYAQLAASEESRAEEELYQSLEQMAILVIEHPGTESSQLAAEALKSAGWEFTREGRPIFPHRYLLGYPIAGE